MPKTERFIIPRPFLIEDTQTNAVFRVELAQRRGVTRLRHDQVPEYVAAVCALLNASLES